MLKNEENVNCYLCKDLYDIDNIMSFLDEDKYFYLCDNCLSSSVCNECNNDIENPKELLYLIDNFKSIDICIICLLNQYKKKECKICKCFLNKQSINKNINIETAPEYIKLKQLNDVYNNKIILLENNIKKLELKSNIEDNNLFKKIQESNNKLQNKCNSLNDEIKALKNDPKKSNVDKKKGVVKNVNENGIYYKNYFDSLLNNNLQPTLSFGALVKKVENDKILINAKNKLKNAFRKITISNKFIKQLNINKNYNMAIRNLFDKIIKNINSKINIKINNPVNKIEKLFSDNINYKYNEIDSQSKLGKFFIENNINNKKELRNHIKINDNFYLNSLINNEDRVSRYIKFSKRLSILNNYLSIDIIIYCKFLNDIRDISEDMFFKLINKVDNYIKNKRNHNITNTISTKKSYKIVF